MNIRQLEFINLLMSWCQPEGMLVDASYAVLGKQLGVSSVAAFLRIKTLERYGWVKRRDGKLYLHPKFSKGNAKEWDAL